MLGSNHAIVPASIITPQFIITHRSQNKNTRLIVGRMERIKAPGEVIPKQTEHKKGIEESQPPVSKVENILICWD